MMAKLMKMVEGEEMSMRETRWGNHREQGKRKCPADMRRERW